VEDRVEQYKQILRAYDTSRDKSQLREMDAVWYQMTPAERRVAKAWSFEFAKGSVH
jgi:phage terminase large subunit-like protein